MSCREPIELGSLVGYWLGELDENETAHLDQHLFGCDMCGARMDEIIALAGGIRSAFQLGSIHTFVTDEFVSGMKDRGVRLREYRVSKNGSVNCTVTSADQILVSRLDAPLDGVTRLDAIGRINDETPHVFHDIPFDARRGVVVMTPGIAIVRRLPAIRFTVRLVAVEGDGDREIGEYTFNHTPGAMPSAS